MYKGTGASPGIALGNALVIEHSELNIEKRNIENIEAEIEKLQSAVETSRIELEKVKERAKVELGEHEAEIFEAHLLVLADPELIDQTISKIKDEKVNADFALNEVKDMFVSIFESMDNEYMRERAADIKDVTNRVLRHILGVKVVDLSALDEEVILIAHDLTPSDTATMNKKMVLGFLTNIGGRTSHTAIMARTLEIAAIVGLNDATDKIKDGDFIVFNGETGEVIINPDEETINQYRKLKAKHDEEKEALKQLIGKASSTLDERHVELAGNIGSPNDLDGLLKNDAEGVGLYRTEFLYMDKEDDFPTEQEQYEAYKAVLEGMNGKPIVIRTLDIGGDKELKYFKMDEEMNPFLGYRAIRLCLDRVDIFKTQLRALYRASVHGKLRIMFPMISSLEELLKAKEVIREVLSELDSEGIKYSHEVEVGM
ncbi:MAG: phosphoenolpyruvate--protein phosphotransferase, partial [Clostridiales bacterium]|nr:phosphoenolpyruvate--protein phosphotransferase [Clostridiales bacterium]